MSEKFSALLTMALKQPIKPEMRRRLLERYPRLTASGTAPPNLDKTIRTLVQKRKNICLMTDSWPSFNALHQTLWSL